MRNSIVSAQAIHNIRRKPSFFYDMEMAKKLAHRFRTKNNVVWGKPLQELCRKPMDFRPKTWTIQGPLQGLKFCNMM